MSIGEASMQDEDRQTLELGSQVFYPGHGIVSVKGIEERNFGGTSQRFYVLALGRGDRLLLPVSNVEKAGVRALVSPDKAEHLLSALNTPPANEVPGSWKARAAAYSDGLRTGSAERYTEILRDLLFRSRASSLSPRDKHAYRMARGYFVAEMAAVLDKPADEIEDAVDRVAGDA